MLLEFGCKRQRRVPLLVGELKVVRNYELTIPRSATYDRAVKRDDEQT
jgi:hypothetical protein